MLVLNRESIIEGLIDLNTERENESEFIVSSIRNIINNEGLNDIEKLKMINNQLNKILSI